MLSINSHFNSSQLNAMRDIGIEFDDNKDYTVDELLDFHERICDELTGCFDSEGESLPLAFIFEKIVDIFYDDFEI